MTILEPQTGQNHQHDQAAPARATGPHENNAQAGREVRGQSPVLQGWKAPSHYFGAIMGASVWRRDLSLSSLLPSLPCSWLYALRRAARLGEKTVR